MENTNDAQFRQYIRLLERKLGLLGDSQRSCCEVTMAQCHAIVEIGRERDISLNKLAELLNLDSSTMSRTINNLVKRSLVKRELDQEDRRYVTISLTEEGNRIFEGIERDTEIYYKKVFETIPNDKRMQTLESMQMILDALDQNESGKGKC